MMKQSNIQFIFRFFILTSILLPSVLINNCIAQTWSKVVDYGDAGYSESGVSWKTYHNPQSNDGSYRYLSHYDNTRKRVGTATWEAEIPYSGIYKVSVSFRSTENRSSDADYYVDNGTGGNDHFSFDQRGDGGLVWKTLGEYHYRKGQRVKILLDGTDDTLSDCADAASWTLVKLTPSSPLVNTIIISSLLFKPGFGDRSQHDLTVTLTGTGTGTVTSFPVSADGTALNCTAGPCSKPYWNNDTVSLTPVADADSHFVKLSGDPDCIDGVVTMNTEKNCIATFELGVEKRKLTVFNASAFSGYGDVSTTPNLIDCLGDPGEILNCSADFDYNSTVTLTANVKDGTFLGWEGDCTVSPTKPLVATVTMNGDKICGAGFIGF